MFKKLFLTLALMLTGPWLGAQTWDVRTHTLGNGMKILVREDHTIPNVAFYLFYRIGSRNEQPGTTGLSHFFEHMMFNTAASAGTPQFDQAIEAAGGASNAYTDYDVTVYQNRAILPRYFYGALFGHHPYGRPPAGNERSLVSIHRDDVVAFHQRPLCLETADQLAALLAEWEFYGLDQREVTESRFFTASGNITH